ncbi:MAG: carbon-nitrogen hydrolase family protein [Lachnospiraceae bacterium]|nr:carbon-nitrogen hydrolase family protein [Lachnospiraceae bacterium]
MDQKVHILALQKKTYASPRENMDAVRDMLAQYKREKPDFLLLPEIFTCPYDNSQFPLFAQKDGDSVYCFLSELARTNHFYVIGGSVPERDEGGKIYNTSYVFDRKGELIGKHRKVHLFDIDVPGGQYFKESDVLSPGKAMTVFDTEYGRMGVCICFDIRFPDLFLQMRRAGVRMVFVPAAFNMTTGPAHWQTLFRSRALDQQIFMAGCSPARDETASYIAYGHSIVTDPWGRILRELDEKEGILDIELDLAETDRIRTQIPLGQ